MKSRIPLLSLGSAAVLVVSFGLTGCSDDANASDGPSTNSVPTVTENTPDETPSAPEQTQSSPVQTQNTPQQNNAAVFNGKIPNLTHSKYTYTIKIDGGEKGGVLEGDFDLNTAAPKWNLTVNADEHTEIERFVEGNLYTKTVNSPGGSTDWQKDSSTAKAKSGTPIKDLPYGDQALIAVGRETTVNASQNTTPTIEWAMKNTTITKVGSETVLGTSCTRWKGVSADKNYQADFWVDAQGNDVKVVVVKKSGEYAGTYTWEFTKRGAPITIAVPNVKK